MAETRTISFNEITENDKRMLEICSNIADLLKRSIPDQSKANVFMKIHGRVNAGMGVAAGKLQRDAGKEYAKKCDKVHKKVTIVVKKSVTIGGAGEKIVKQPEVKDCVNKLLVKFRGNVDKVLKAMPLLISRFNSTRVTKALSSSDTAPVDEIKMKINKGTGTKEEQEIIKGLTDKEVHDEIVKIVDDSSGGIKFVDLLVVLSAHYGKDINDFRKMPDYLENLCRTSKVIKVLDYQCRNLNRHKMFIYTE